MYLRAPAIILSVRPHGENGAIVRALTEESGVQPGYVRGGHSRRFRPVLQPANSVLGEWRARHEGQLPALTVELTASRAPLYGEPLAAVALDWVTVLTAAALPEGQPYPALYAALDGVIGAVEAAPAARGWAVALVRYELLMLSVLGFGLDLSRCAVTQGANDLAWVSPKSGRAVSRAAGQGYADRLLPYPTFLQEGGGADWGDILDGLRLTGHFLARDLLTDRQKSALAARERLVERLKRAVA
ncbi:DNA repair protein RecO [Stakelama sediminis]|uniref:DNA repair protein RecO n=1 Tax=Stakelama sediminis TaxID=463200 RepID=A0A840YVL2_9SPHN|nr:DNA repair protein RecO [Stakelama sediminis]MBB5717597.1 DNA repair protein RecO (recombination protein O) [Stakelama sediminis]